MPETSNQIINPTVDINTLLKLIPKFNSDSSELYAFLNGCDDAMSLASSSQQDFIFKYIKVQITGNARVILENKVIENWLQLKEQLKKLYKDTNSTLGLYRELINSRQENRTVRQYEQHMETMSRRLGSDAKEDLKEADVKDIHVIHNYIENKIILNIFINGLKSELGNYVNNCRPTTLAEAARYAQHEESRLANQIRTPRQDFTNKNLVRINFGQTKCNNCNKVGHLEKNCFSKKTFANKDISKSYEKFKCFKCGKAGHIAKNCYTQDKNTKQIFFQ